MKVQIQCPTCKATGHIEITEAMWATVKGEVLIGHVRRGRICDHEFHIHVDRKGQVQKYRPMEPEAPEPVTPVKFTVQSAIRNLGEEIVATLLTAGVSEMPVLLVGWPAVTMGLKNFVRRVLPESVDTDQLIYAITREQYQKLSAEQRKLMIINLKDQEVLNSTFDEEQLEWVRQALVRAKMMPNQRVAENLIVQETTKLRTTVSLLRHLAARRTDAPVNNSESAEQDNQSSQE